MKIQNSPPRITSERANARSQIELTGVSGSQREAYLWPPGLLNVFDSFPEGFEYPSAPGEARGLTGTAQVDAKPRRRPGLRSHVVLILV